MDREWAGDFDEILPTLAVRKDLMLEVDTLVRNERIPGKTLEGRGRVYKLRPILLDLIHGNITLYEASARAENELMEVNSPYAGDENVFSKDWGERIVRVNLSRFYNQAVLMQLLYAGEENCFIPHSPEKDISSGCRRDLPGKRYNVVELLEAIVDTYSNGNWDNDRPKVPEHPYCNHVVRPLT